jgi:hypothetical protein
LTAEIAQSTEIGDGNFDGQISQMDADGPWDLRSHMISDGTIFTRDPPPLKLQEDREGERNTKGGNGILA